MDKFKVLYDKFVGNTSAHLNWNSIELIDKSIITENVNNITDAQKSVITDKVCVIKLNGGLGTSMGCDKAKSLMHIKDDYTFMDIILEQQKLHANIPLVFMNSFFTHDDTNEYLTKQMNDLTISTFNQSTYPRIVKETKQYYDINSGIKEHLYPPGHGDLFESMYVTGLLDKLLSMGIEYGFIGNSDNLGATLNFDILDDFINSDVEFALELTPKTLNDVKGGTLIKYDGKYTMFEVAQCPPDKLSEFTSIEKFKYFNTNNVWVKLSAIKKLMATYYLKHVDIIVNNKKLKDGTDVIQLEYAIGSMVKFFDKIKCYVVGRDRFIPVKTNNDLALVRSDIYKLNKNCWKLDK